MTEKKYECNCKDFTCSNLIMHRKPSFENCVSVLNGMWCQYLKEVPAEPELVICPEPCDSQCDHKNPHKRFNGCRFNCGTIDHEVEGCVPYKPEARTTSESTPGKQSIKLSGRPSRGCSCGSCFLTTRITGEGAYGAEISQPLSNTMTGASTALKLICGFSTPGASLCVTPVTERSEEVYISVRDVEGKDIMLVKVTCVSSARERTGSKESSTEKSSGSETGTVMKKKEGGGFVREKKSGTGSGSPSELLKRIEDAAEKCDSSWCCPVLAMLCDDEIEKIVPKSATKAPGTSHEPADWGTRDPCLICPMEKGLHIYCKGCEKNK